MSDEFTRRRLANVQPMLTLDQAWHIIAAKLTELQDRQLRCDLPPLTDMTDGERYGEIVTRLNRVDADGPSVDLLAAIGVYVVAWIRAVDARDQVDVTSGDDAA